LSPLAVVLEGDGRRSTKCGSADVGWRGEVALGACLRVRNVVLAVLGAALLVFKPAYHGPLEDVVYSYAGNFYVADTGTIAPAGDETQTATVEPEGINREALRLAVDDMEFDGFGDGKPMLHEKTAPMIGTVQSLHIGFAPPSVPTSGR
jgi:hypothetical protein